MKKLNRFLFVFLLFGTCASCAENNKQEELITKELAVIHETKYNSSYAGITNEEFLSDWGKPLKLRISF